ncbi:MAG: O-antigen ligase family protein [Terriglobales bacterium]
MDRTFRLVIAGLPVLLVLALVVLARSFPGYFNNQQYLAGFIFLQILLVCLWSYDRLFFPFLMIAFLWAGMDLPMSAPWTMARWVVLGAGALAGIVHGLRMGFQRFNPFHVAALLCVASALASAMVSALPQFSLMKVFSLLLLFLYGSLGARLVLRHPDRFFRGLLLACEICVYGSAVSYLILGYALWGSTNSLGAVQGVVTVPLLLWGTLVAQEKNLRLRRAVACLGALYLVYFSITRAAMLAACLAMLVLLLGLRRHKLILQGLVGAACVVAITAIAVPAHFDELKNSLVTGVIYKGHQDQGLLGSRLTPWRETLQVIQENPYFGSGFGTSTSGDKPFGEGGKFSSTSLTNREHGSSYLAITEWVGLLGILPFTLLIFLLIQAIIRVYLFLRRTGNAAHYSVPLTMVLIAGLAHAFFEDWLFAVGYYLTVLFWSFAFLLMDLVPESAPHQTAFVHGMRFRYATAPAVTRP